MRLCVDLLGKPFFLWFPSARPSILSEPKIIIFFLDMRYLNSIFLGERSAVNSMFIQLIYAHSNKDAVEHVYVYIFIVYQYMESTYTVSCVSGFVPWVFVLHFMPKDLHFDCAHRVYRRRQRILTAYHCRRYAFVFFIAPTHPSTPLR